MSTGEQAIPKLVDEQPTRPLRRLHQPITSARSSSAAGEIDDASESLHDAATRRLRR